MKKATIFFLLVFAVALYIGIPKLIHNGDAYDLSEVPRFYASRGYYVFLDAEAYNTGVSFGKVRGPSDAIDYAVSYRLSHWGEELDAGREVAFRTYSAYYDPDSDMWMVYDRPKSFHWDTFSFSRHDILYPTMDTQDSLTFIRGADGYILAFLPDEWPASWAFEPGGSILTDRNNRSE